MRPALFFAILAAKRYKKKHNLPDVRVLDDKHLEKFSLENKNRNYDCTTVDDKYKKGLNLERIDLPNCSSWLISKDDNPKDKVLYYIHGGGFVNGSTRDAFRFVSYATKHFGYNVYSIDYRTTPDHVCLDTISDVENGYKTLLERYKPKDIILMGESAGGNLVFALTHRLKDLGLPLPGGIISCSPVVQFLHYAYSYYECSNKTDYGITFGINSIVEYYRG